MIFTFTLNIYLFRLEYIQKTIFLYLFLLTGGSEFTFA